MTLTIQHPSTLVEPGALTRFNPAVKLITLFVVSVSMLFIWEPIRPALLWAVLVIIALTIGNVPARWLAYAHIPFIAFGIGLFLVNVLARADDGVAIGAALAGRTLVIGVASILFLTSTARGSDALAEPEPQTARLNHLRRAGRLPAAAGTAQGMADHPRRPADAARRGGQTQSQGQTQTHAQRGRAVGLHRAHRGPASVRTNCDVVRIPRLRAQTTNRLPAHPCVC